MRRRGIRLAQSPSAMKKKKARTGAITRSARTPADPAQAIASLRGQIDATDSEILKLLDRRAGLASEIGEEKRKLQSQAKPGERKSFTFYDPEREQRIFERLSSSRSEGGPGFPRGAVAFVFREVISGCRS